MQTPARGGVGGQHPDCDNGADLVFHFPGGSMMSAVAKRIRQEGSWCLHQTPRLGGNGTYAFNLSLPACMQQKHANFGIKALGTA